MNRYVKMSRTVWVALWLLSVLGVFLAAENATRGTILVTAALGTGLGVAIVALWRTLEEPPLYRSMLEFNRMRGNQSFHVKAKLDETVPDGVGRGGLYLLEWQMRVYPGAMFTWCALVITNETLEVGKWYRSQNIRAAPGDLIVVDGHHVTVVPPQTRHST